MIQRTQGARFQFETLAADWAVRDIQGQDL
jgi:hypothetical protein